MTPLLNLLDFSSDAPPSEVGMTWLEFFSSMFASFMGAAWPMAFAAVAFYYRRPITRLIARAKRINLFGNEAEFVEELLQDAELNADLNAPPDEPLPENRESDELFYKLAEISPEAAIVRKWQDVEIWIESKISPITSPRLRRILTRPKELLDLGVLDYEGVALLNDLRALRNAAAHSKNISSSISKEQAIRYVELANKLMNIKIKKGEGANDDG